MLERTLRRGSLWMPLMSATLLLGLSGCLTREITYSIGADGSAAVQFVARGDRTDIEQGDLMPPKGPWEVKESEVTKPDGKKESVYEAKRSFARVEEIPPSFATAAARFPDAYLQTPVKLTKREEGNATVYEFTVTFKSRKWKEYEDLLSEIAGADLIDLSKKYGFEKLTKDEQLTLCTATARWPLRIESDCIATALAKVSGPAGIPAEKIQSVLLRIEDAFDRIVTKEAMAAILAGPEAERGKAFEDLKARARAAAEKVLDEEFAGAPYAEVLKKIRDDVARETLEWEITNDLGDETFIVKVDMPGNIVQSNGDKIEGNRVQWRFNAEKFRDADCVLSVTSRQTK
jgi:hypothetical protein